jgi:tetratricopeptide (TPR) repeat protein
MSSVEHMFEQGQEREQEHGGDGDGAGAGVSVKGKASGRLPEVEKVLQEALQEALSLFHAAIEHKPSNNDAIENIVTLYSREGRHEEAAAVIIAGLDGGNAAWNAAAGAPAAAAAAAAAVAANPTHAGHAHYRQVRMLAYSLQKSGTRLLKEGRTEEAEQQLLTSLRLAPSLVGEAASNMGVISTTRGDYRTALEYFQAAHEILPSPTTEGNMQLCQEILAEEAMEGGA